MGDAGCTPTKASLPRVANGKMSKAKHPMPRRGGDRRLGAKKKTTNNGHLTHRGEDTKGSSLQRATDPGEGGGRGGVLVGGFLQVGGGEQELDDVVEVALPLDATELFFLRHEDDVVVVNRIETLR